MRTDKGTIIAAVILLAAVFFIGVKNPTGKGVYSFESNPEYIQSVQDGQSWEGGGDMYDDIELKVDDGYADPGSSPDVSDSGLSCPPDFEISKGPVEGEHKDKKKAKDRAEEKCLDHIEEGCDAYCSAGACFGALVEPIEYEESGYRYNKEHSTWIYKLDWCAAKCDCEFN